MRAAAKSVLTVRAADPAERRALKALQFRASVVWDEYRDALLAHPDAVELPLEQILAGRVYVAERAGAVVGFCAVLPRDDGNAELDGLFVEPAVWREGIGARLVRAAEQRASSDGAAFLCVVANPRAAAFYTACGFTLTGEEQTRFGIAQSMRKLLTEDRRENDSHSRP